MRFDFSIISYRGDGERGKIEPHWYNMPKREKEDCLFNVTARGENNPNQRVSLIAGGDSLNTRIHFSNVFSPLPIICVHFKTLKFSIDFFQIFLDFKL